MTLRETVLTDISLLGFMVISNMGYLDAVLYVCDKLKYLLKVP